MWPVGGNVCKDKGGLEGNKDRAWNMDAPILLLTTRNFTLLNESGSSKDMKKNKTEGANSESAAAAAPVAVYLRLFLFPCFLSFSFFGFYVCWSGFRIIIFLLDGGFPL